MKNKISTLTILLISFFSFGQIDCEQVVSRKDYMLIQLFDVLENTTETLRNDAYLSYNNLQGKRASYFAYRKNTDYVDFWLNNAQKIKEKTKKLIHEILEEMDTIAKLADNSKQAYIIRNGYERMALNFYPITRLINYDNRIIPNDRLIGEDAERPKPKGLDIERAIREYKKEILHLIADYTHDGKSYKIKENVVDGEIKLDFSLANPEDTSFISSVHQVLAIGFKRYTKDLNSDETIAIPWISEQFRYSSVLETFVTAQRILMEIAMIEKEALHFIDMKVPRAMQ